MTEGEEDELRVAVPVNVERDTLLITDFADEIVHPFVFGGVARLFAAVDLLAGVWGGAAGVGVPVCFPVAVDLCRYG